MRVSLNNMFAPRYALGGAVLAFLVFFFTWKFLETEGAEPQGLLRLYALLVVFFSPWFLLTWFTRLRIKDDRVIWRTFPLAQSFSLKEIDSLKRIDSGAPGAIARLEIVYAKGGRRGRVVLTPHIFPQKDVRAFLQEIQRQRPDLSSPYFPY